MEVEKKFLFSYEEKGEIIWLHTLEDSVTDFVIRFNVHRTTIESLMNDYRKSGGSTAKGVQFQFFESSVAEAGIQGQFPSAK